MSLAVKSFMIEGNHISTLTKMHRYASSEPLLWTVNESFTLQQATFPEHRHVFLAVTLIFSLGWASGDRKTAIVVMGQQRKKGIQRLRIRKMISALHNCFSFPAVITYQGYKSQILSLLKRSCPEEMTTFHVIWLSAIWHRGFQDKLPENIQSSTWPAGMIFPWATSCSGGDIPHVFCSLPDVCRF